MTDEAGRTKDGAMTMSDGPRHAVTRIRRETRRRQGTVVSIERLSPSMLRIWLEGEDLRDFESAAPDDHIKLFFATDDGETAMRDYTPRRFDPAAGRLAIDFALHEAGPATRWAIAAKVGDTLQIGGPRGSAVLADDFDWYLLIGDETALPAIGRRLEELRADVPVTAIIAVDDEGDCIDPSGRPNTKLVWLVRSRRSIGDGEAVIAALTRLGLPSGEGYVWIAAEAEVARAVRSHVIDTLGHPRSWTKASGYWSAGEAGANKKIED
jgi:NADPH-dependent ferric siderophore reductase